MGLFGPDAATVLATSKQPEKVLKALASPKSPAGAMGLVLTNPNLSGPALEMILATLSREQILALLDTPRMSEKARDQLLVTAVNWVDPTGKNTLDERLKTITRILANNSYEGLGLARPLAQYAVLASQWLRTARQAGDLDPAPTATRYQGVFDALQARLNAGRGTKLLEEVIAENRRPGEHCDKDKAVKAWHHMLRRMPVTETGLRAIQTARRGAGEGPDEMAWLAFLVPSNGWESLPAGFAIDLATTTRVVSREATRTSIDLVEPSSQARITLALSTQAKAGVLAHLCKIDGATKHPIMVFMAAACAAAAPNPRAAVGPWLEHLPTDACLGLLEAGYPAWQIPVCAELIQEHRIRLTRELAWQALTTFPHADGQLVRALVSIHGHLSEDQTTSVLLAGGDYTVDTSSVSRIEAILATPHLFTVSDDLIEQFAHDPEPRIRAAAAQTGRLTAKTLGSLALEIDPTVLAGIAQGGLNAPAGNRAYNAKVATLVAGSTTDPDVLENLLRWRTPPAELLAQLATSNHVGARAGAARVPALAGHPDLAAALAADPDASVALALAQNDTVMCNPPRAVVDALLDAERNDASYVGELAEALNQVLQDEGYDAATAKPALKYLMRRFVELPGAADYLAGWLFARQMDTLLLGRLYTSAAFDPAELDDIDVAGREDSELAALARAAPLGLRTWLAQTVTRKQAETATVLASDPDLTVRHTLASRRKGALAPEAGAILAEDPVPAVRTLAAKHLSQTRSRKSPRTETGTED